VLPPFWRPTVGVSVVDADHVRGAVIVRVDPGGAAARAGLKPGSTIVAAGGQPVASVADWRAALQKVAPGAPIVVDVQGPDQTAVPLIVGIEADALPFVTGSTSLRGSPLPANLALVNLQDAVARAGTTPAGAGIARAAWLNQAIVHRQLGNWAEALAALDRAAPSDATDAAAAGVIAYYKGLCLEQLDRRDAADAEFQKAAAARTARLSPDGPLVWPLAQAKIRPAR
jgi:tetratricopeptide (TPR) repeat protein